jgi:hypothetical protein
MPPKPKKRKVCEWKTNKDGFTTITSCGCVIQHFLGLWNDKKFCFCGLPIFEKKGGR